VVQPVSSKPANTAAAHALTQVIEFLQCRWHEYGLTGGELHEQRSRSTGAARNDQHVDCGAPDIFGHH
jgi:hypothetical protein